MTREEQIIKASHLYAKAQQKPFIDGAKWADEHPKEKFCIDRVETTTRLSTLDIFNMSRSRATSSLDAETLLVNMAIEKCQHALQNIILSQKYTTYEVDRESDAGNIIVKGYLYIKKKEE